MRHTYSIVLVLCALLILPLVCIGARSRSLSSRDVRNLGKRMSLDEPTDAPEDDHHEHSPLEELIEAFDTDKDGLISMDEYTVYYDNFFNDSAVEANDVGHDHNHMRKRAEHNATECPYAADLFDEFAVNSTLDETQFRDVTVEMVFYHTVLSCQLHDETAVGMACPPNKQEAWVWAILASLGITLLSAVGVVLLPVNGEKATQYLFQALLGLSAGSMFGDAILHLIPHALEPAFAFSTEEAVHIHALKIGLLTLASTFLSVLVEKAFLVANGIRKRSGKGGGDPQKLADSEDEDPENGHVTHHGHQHHHSLGTIKAFGWINLLSDGLHNFTDGLGIGAAFMASPGLGLSTTIAVVVHEVPQEFGDFALLIKAGFTKRKALAWNLLSGCLAVLGTVIGCGIASTDAQPWILSFVAGTFLYVALADVIPELNHDSGIAITLLQLLGILLGFIIMAGLVLAEMRLQDGLVQQLNC